MHGFKEMVFKQQECKSNRPTKVGDKISPDEPDWRIGCVTESEQSQYVGAPQRSESMRTRSKQCASAEKREREAGKCGFGLVVLYCIERRLERRILHGSERGDETESRPTRAFITQSPKPNCFHNVLRCSK